AEPAKSVQQQPTPQQQTQKEPPTPAAPSEQSPARQELLERWMSSPNVAEVTTELVMR
ncbi:unnamed protein product, partial [Effrenium voratum]